MAYSEKKNLTSTLVIKLHHNSQPKMFINFLQLCIIIPIT